MDVCHGQNSTLTTTNHVCARPNANTHTQKALKTNGKDRMKYWPAFTIENEEKLYNFFFFLFVSTGNSKNVIFSFSARISNDPPVDVDKTTMKNRKKKKKREKTRRSTMHLNTLTGRFFFGGSRFTSHFRSNVSYTLWLISNLLHFQGTQSTSRQ